MWGGGFFVGTVCEYARAVMCMWVCARDHVRVFYYALYDCFCMFIIYVCGCARAIMCVLLCFVRLFMFFCLSNIDLYVGI